MLYLLKVPKVQLTICLLLVFISTLNVSLLNFPLLIGSVSLTIFFDILFTFFRKKVLFIPWAAIATGLIIALISDPHLGLYKLAVICFIAMASKNFLRISNKHIFNPAALGLFLGGIILNSSVSWWGVSFQTITDKPWAFLVLLTPAYVSFYRMKRFGSILSFLLLYALLTSFLSHRLTPQVLINNLLDPTTIFFAIVMLAEPMTSPFKLKRQILYGIAVAITTLTLSYPAISSFLSGLKLLPDVLIPSLLLANMLFFKYR